MTSVKLYISNSPVRTQNPIKTLEQETSALLETTKSRNGLLHSSRHDCAAARLHKKALAGRNILTTIRVRET